MYELFVGNQPTGSGWRKAVGAGSPCPPPIYRPTTSHLSAPENPSVGRISSIRGMICDTCDGADKSAVGTINRPLHCPYAHLPTTNLYTHYSPLLALSITCARILIPASISSGL